MNPLVPSSFTLLLQITPGMALTLVGMLAVVCLTAILIALILRRRP